MEMESERKVMPVGRASLRAARLPPLNLLRTFESAAWHSSFTEASRELNVTQSAVSQQIRQLEGLLGQRLFDRLPRSLQLTPEGAIFANSVRESLSMIARATLRLRDPSAPTSLKVDAFPSFGARWLSGRMASFLDENPSVTLTMTTSKDQAAKPRAGVDLAIRWFSASERPDNAVSLGAQPILPVCSPAFLERHGPMALPADIQSARRLQTLERNHWPAWFEAAGLPAPLEESGPYFGDATMMLEACIEGQGIGLATYFLVERDISSGRLICPVDFGIEIGEGFHLLDDGGPISRPASLAFKDWLMASATASLARAPEWCTNVRSL